jgi:hypothetical protein
LQLDEYFDFSTRVCPSAYQYQLFLTQRPPSLTSQLDMEYQYLMEEHNNICDQNTRMRKELLRKAGRSVVNHN